MSIAKVFGWTQNPNRIRKRDKQNNREKGKGFV